MTEPSDPRPDLLDSIATARWFGGKGRAATLGTVVPLPWLQPAGDWPAVRSEVAEIRYAPTGVELYQLVLAYYPESQPTLGAPVTVTDDPALGTLFGYDAVHDPAATRLLLRLLVAGARFEDDGTDIELRTSRTGVLTTDLEPTPFGGQQSNTSIMYGDVAMLKLFRRLELGRNLDIAVHDELSRAGVADVAQLYGWVSGRWTGPDPDGVVGDVAADLGMVVEKLSGAVDGWELALASLDPDPVTSAGSGGFATSRPTGFAEDATALGTALAHVHLALRTAFPTAPLPGDQVADTMINRLDAAVLAAPALEPYVPGLRATFDRLRGTTLTGQRVHGDFHLGQTLHTPAGWKIIDFEGEPAKTMAERLAPDSVWRDLAGMLRSFDYAAASRPGPDSAAWSAACRDGFLAGYLGGLDDGDQSVLAAYEADKAVYEVVYETRNRPDWIAIPLSAVAVLTGLISGRSTDAALGGTR